MQYHEKKLTFQFVHILHISVDCTHDYHCNNGQTCDNNACTCTQDSQCASTQACQNGKCQEATCDNVACGTNASCEVSDNQAACKCDSGYYSVTSPDDGCGKFQH